MTQMELALTVEAEEIRSEEAGGFDVWSAKCHVTSRVAFDFAKFSKGGYDYTMSFELRRGDERGLGITKLTGDAIWEIRERGRVANGDDFEKVLAGSIARLYARFITAWRQSHP